MSQGNQQQPQQEPQQPPVWDISQEGGAPSDPHEFQQSLKNHSGQPQPGAEAREDVPPVWQEANNQSAPEPQGQETIPGAFVPNLVRGEPGEDTSVQNWQPLNDNDLPPIHDERLGAKTFVPNVALELYEIAAKAGDAQAQYSLGLCYHYGEGTLKDPNKAFKWFTEAAHEGHAEAQYSLGVYYQLGIGTPRNAESAFRWFDLAAKQNQAKAQHELGESYFNGRGVEKDPAMAKKWISKSYINGNKRASASWEKYQLWKY